MIADRVVGGGPVILGADVSPVPLAYVQVTDLSVATGIPDTPPDACRAIISVSGAPVRWRDDGQDPTSTAGMPISPGETFTYEGPVSALRFVGPNAVLDCALYR